MNREETGIEELRALMRMAANTKDGAFATLTAEQCVRVMRAVRACGWDIYPDQLTPPELKHAARRGALPAAFAVRARKVWG